MNVDIRTVAIAGAFFILLFCLRAGQAADSDRWILYGTTDMAESYYDKNAMTRVGPQIITVWNKDKYSKAGRDEIIQRRRSLDLPVSGYDKLDYVIDFIELDCENRTIKDIRFAEYDHEDRILYDYSYPSPRIKHILPGTTTETLLKTVCP